MAENQDEIDALCEKRICNECIGDAYLKADAQKRNQVFQCSYCDRTAPTLTIDEMTDYIEWAFERHYRQTTAYTPSGPKGDDVVYAIGDAAQIEPEP